MPVHIRVGDIIRPDDDLVLRAGGGDPKALTASAVENARLYEPLVARSELRSPYTISVNIPRPGVADQADILGSPPYMRYKPYLRASAALILPFNYLEIVPTTVVVDGVEPTDLDLCHFDIVIEAVDAVQLLARISEVRSRFTRLANPFRSGTLTSEGESDA